MSVLKKQPSPPRCRPDGAALDQLLGFDVVFTLGGLAAGHRAQPSNTLTHHLFQIVFDPRHAGPEPGKIRNRADTRAHPRAPGCRAAAGGRGRITDSNVDSSGSSSLCRSHAEGGLRLNPGTASEP